MARPTKTPIAVPASFIDGSCGRRPMTRMSNARIATMIAIVAAQA